MVIRVPLVLGTVAAVIHRLDPAATASFDPPGAQTSGYDPDFHTPVIYSSTATGDRTDSRKELTVVRVPCQVETFSFEQLRKLFPGNTPSSNMALVFSRIDLESLGLLDSATRKVKINVNDRVEKLERRSSPGSTVHPIKAPGLFIFEIRPRSWGFGPDGHDLDVAFLDDRSRAV